MTLIINTFLLTLVVIVQSIAAKEPAKGSVKESQKLTRELFYRADASAYTKEFCSSMRSMNFIESILPERIKSETASWRNFESDEIDGDHESKTKKQKADAQMEIDKPRIKAFKTLFDSCRWYMLMDSVMARDFIIHIISTENSKYLSLLLDWNQTEPQKQTGKSKLGDETRAVASDGKLQFKNVYLSSEDFFLVFHEIFRIEPGQDPRYLFMHREPHLALAYVLAYCNLDPKSLHEYRDILEKLTTAKDETYADYKSPATGIQLIDHYTNHPESIGDHNAILDENQLKTSVGWPFVAGVILVASACFAVILGVYINVKREKMI